ncbi:MAG: MGMT family protein [Flavobacteriales bacterium]|nr:MGMT family protein [Flavobacteriales bacterium]
MKITNFNKDVIELVWLIPKGRVTSYGAIANYLGAKKSSRMVGWVLNSTFNIPNFPAHRVVNRFGLLSGKAHFCSLTKMEELLLIDGVKVENDLVVKFNEIFWDPMIELKL